MTRKEGARVQYIAREALVIFKRYFDTPEGSRFKMCYDDMAAKMEELNGCIYDNIDEEKPRSQFE